MESDRDITLPSPTPGYGSRIGAQLIAVAQLMLGGTGLLGVLSYLADDRSNPSRYQYLFVPAWAFVFAIPLLIVSALLCRRCWIQMTSLERWALTIGCALPIVALGTAIAVSTAGW